MSRSFRRRAGNRRKVDGLGRRFLLVDPLDGTREFLAGLDEYTVNIALVENGAAVAGVIAAPARGLIWRGYVGDGAERLALTPGAGPRGGARTDCHPHPRRPPGATRAVQPLASRGCHLSLCRSVGRVRSGFCAAPR